MNTAPWVKKPPDKETGKRMLSSNAMRVSISEEDNVDRHGVAYIISSANGRR
jgi:hypothetical protein